MRQHHDAPTVGHLRIAKIIARIAERFYWPDSARSRRTSVSVQTARHTKRRRNPRGATTCYRGKMPMALGDDRPSRTATTIATRAHLAPRAQDRFSKWTELTPLHKATAAAVTKAITERIILKHGCPYSQTTEKNLCLANLRNNWRHSKYNTARRRPVIPSKEQIAIIKTMVN